MCLVSSHHPPLPSPSSYVPSEIKDITLLPWPAGCYSPFSFSPPSIHPSLLSMRPTQYLSSRFLPNSFHSPAKAFPGLIISLTGCWKIFLVVSLLHPTLFYKFIFISDNIQTALAGIQSPSQFYHFQPFVLHLCWWAVPITNLPTFQQTSTFSALTQIIQSSWHAFHFLSPISNPSSKFSPSSLIITELALPLSSSILCVHYLLMYKT